MPQIRPWDRAPGIALEKLFSVFEYTVHILPAIFPDSSKNLRECSEEMCKKNYELWKETYESFYGIKLEYTTEGEVSPCSI